MSAAPKKRAVKKTERKFTLPASTPRGDAPQTRTADTQRAEQFKKTPEYRESIRVARKTQPESVRRARVERAETKERLAARQKGQALGVEDRAVLDQHRSEVERNLVLKEGRARFTGTPSTAEQTRIDEFKKADKAKQLKKKAKKDVGDKAAGVTADVLAHAATSFIKPADVVLGAVGAPKPSDLARDFVHTQLQTVRAANEDLVHGKVPRVWTNTAKAIPGTAKATAAGVAEPFVTAARHPSAKNIGRAVASPAVLVAKSAVETERSLNERGEQARKDPKAFRARKKREGALEELSDATLAVPGAGAVVGRAATSVARTGALGPKLLKVATKPRPKLRVTAGEGGAKPQAKSKNLFVAAAQDARDNTRRKKATKRAVKAARDEDAPVRGLVPGEGEVVRRRLRKQRADQRTAVASDLSRGYTRLKSRQSAEIHGGVSKERSVARKKLSGQQKRAFDDMETLAEKGLVNFDDPAKTREVLAAYKQRITTKRAEPGAKTPAKPSSDELARIDRVLATIDDPQVRSAMKGYHAQQVERHGRLRSQDQTLDDLTAEVRVRQPQGRVLGESDLFEQQVARIEAKREAGEITEDGAKKLVDNARSQYVARTKQAAEAKGLPEPVYVPDRPRKGQNFSDYAAGGSKAVQGHKRSEFRLFDEGRADTTPGAYDQGVARTIKRNVNWNTVSDTYERHTPEWGRGKTVEQLRNEIDAKNLDPRDWRMVDLGRIRKTREAVGETEGRADDLLQAGDSQIHDAITKATFKLDGTEAEFKGTGRKFSLVPKAVADELETSSKPSGPVGRTIQKIQGAQSRVILATNPLYVPQQVVSQTAIALPATRGKILSGRGNRLYKRLSPEGKEAFDEWVGISPTRDMAGTARYGAALDNRLVRGFHALVDSDGVQRARESRFNPLHWNFMVDEKQNALFRREMLVDSLKRLENGEIKALTNDAIAGYDDLVKVLEAKGPDRLARLKQAEPALERAAERVDDLLGNWTRYTATERRTIKRGLLFYGFLRWATKFTFYTMPVKHPITTSILSKIGQMQTQEVVDLLGDEFFASPESKDGKYTREEIEEAIRKELLAQVGGRVYFKRDGKLAYFDAAKVNPFAGPLVDALSDPKKTSFGLISPAAQAALNAAIGKDAAFDIPLNTKGRITEFGKEPTVGTGEFFRIVGRDTLRISPALRMLDETLTGDVEQGDDSLPLIGDRPLQPRTQKQAQKTARKVDAKSNSAVSRAAETGVAGAYRPNDSTIASRVRGAGNFPALDRLHVQVEDIERRVRAGRPELSNEKVRAIAYRDASYRKAKDEIKRLEARAGMRPKTKKARRKSGLGGGGLGGGGLGGGSLGGGGLGG